MAKVLILGGTRGLGKALARLSLRHGHETVVAGRSNHEILSDPGTRDALCVRFNLFELSDPGSDAFTLPHTPPWERVLEEGVTSDIFCWVAGNCKPKPFHETVWDDIELMAGLHFMGPLYLLSGLLRQRIRSGDLRPLHLVVVSATTGFACEEGQAVMGALQAAKGHFANCLAGDLKRHLPTSRVSIFNLDGSAPTGRVAAAIWRKVEVHQKQPYNDTTHYDAPWEFDVIGKWAKARRAVTLRSYVHDFP